MRVEKFGEIDDETVLDRDSVEDLGVHRFT